MRIVLLGTSHGVPEPGRRCACAMIEAKGNIYFIDMGFNAIEELRNRNIDSKNVKAVFFTHNHCDHTGGLFQFICGMNCWWHRFSNPVFYLPKPKENILDAIAAFYKSQGSSAFPKNEFFEINEGALFDDGVIKVTAFKTKHCDESFAYLVESEGKRVFFSGDLCPDGPKNDFPLSVIDTPIDLMVLECAHFNATEYLPLFEDKKENISKICFTHYTNQRTPTIYEFINTFKSAEAVIASDGTEFYI